MLKKTIILLLMLSIASTLIACSRSTVDSTSNGIDSSSVETSQNKELDQNNSEQQVVDPKAIPLEVYGTKIEKYEGLGHTKKIIGNPSNIKEIEIRDMDGNYLMTFNSGKTAGDYDHLRFVSGYSSNIPIEYFDSITPDDPVYIAPKSMQSVALDIGHGKGISVTFANFTDANVSMFDLECVRITFGAEGYPAQIIEDLGTPTAIYAQWTNRNDPKSFSIEHTFVSSYRVIWKCDGFFAIASYDSDGSLVTDESEYNFDLTYFALLRSENGRVVAPDDEQSLLYQFGWNYEAYR